MGLTCEFVVAGTGFEPRDLRVMRSSIWHYTNEIEMNGI